MLQTAGAVDEVVIEMVTDVPPSAQQLTLISGRNNWNSERILLFQRREAGREMAVGDGMTVISLLSIYYIQAFFYNMKYLFL